MIEYSDALCRELCRAGRVALEISTIEDKRKDGRSASGHARCRIVIALAATILWLSCRAARRSASVIAAAIIVLVSAASSRLRPLGKAGKALKVPALETIAEKGGLTYMETRLRSAGLSRGAQGAVRQLALDARPSPTCSTPATRTAGASRSTKAVLVRGSGKSRHTVFSGQIYAWQRRARAAARSSSSPTAASSTSSSRSAAWSGSGSRATRNSRSKFEVYAFEPQQAMMIVGADLRRAAARSAPGGPRLRLYRARGRVLIAGWGRNQLRARLDVPRRSRRAARPRHARGRLRRASRRWRSCEGAIA